MAFREIHVVLVYEVIRRWQAGEAVRAVAVAVGVDRKTVRRYIEAAQRRGVGPGGEPPAEALLTQIQAELRPGGSSECGPSWKHCEAHRDAILEWLEDGARGPKVAELLLRTTGKAVPLRTLSRFIRSELRPARRSATVRLAEHPPGKVVEIDHVELGTVQLADGPVKLWALACVAVHSRHLFLWPCRSTGLDDLIEGLEAAWGFFGGVFPVVVADNQRAIVARADPLQPTLTPAFLEYSQARGFLVDLARVRRPQDKPRVERSIGYAWGSCFAGERFRSLEEMRQHAASWCMETAGRRVHGTTRLRPLEAFEAERPLLAPPPAEPYDRPCWHRVMVGMDQMVTVAGALYSVPRSVGRCAVRVRVDRATVRIYANDGLVKAHVRAPRGSVVVDPADVPEGVRPLVGRDPEALVRAATAHGPAVGELARRHLDGHLQWSRARGVHRLLRLCAAHGDAAVQRACEEALKHDVTDVICVQRMLERPAAPAPPSALAAAPPPPASRSRFARSMADFHLAAHRRPDAP